MITIEREMRMDALRRVENLPVLFFEGEAYAHKFMITPVGGVSFDGYDATARMVLSDGTDTTIVAPGANIVDGAVEVILTPACYSVPGPVKLFIYVTNSSETVCVYACATAVLETVGANGSAPDADTIIESYSGGIYGYVFEGGPDGRLSANGVTAANEGRLYTLSGTGTAYANNDIQRQNALQIAVLDGCVDWENRSATLKLKKGHTYRFSMQSNKYPMEYFEALNLWVCRAGTSSTLLKVRPGVVVPNNAPEDGAEIDYYCTADTEVQVMLSILTGLLPTGSSDPVYFNYTSSATQILIGIADVTGEENMPMVGLRSGSSQPPVPTMRVKQLYFCNTGADDMYLFGYSDAKILSSIVSLSTFTSGMIKLGDTILTEKKLKDLLALL